LLKNTFPGCQSLAAAEAGGDFAAITASLKRCPDTKQEFFSKL
jgi:hypothetical protein